MAVSDQLTKLAARAKEAEDHAAAAQGKARADLEQDVEKARTSAQAQADKLRAAADAKKGKLSVWWNDMERSWHEHVEKSAPTSRKGGQATTWIGPRDGPSTPKKMPPLPSTLRTRPSRRPSTRRSMPHSREWRLTSSPRLQQQLKR